MSDLEIQKDAIIEIVGTQHDGRAINHENLHPQQKLVMRRQKDNPHDSNAILVLTEQGKELGYLSKGYALLYAPAMDSNKYLFAVEVVKTEPDPERPILIVRVRAEYKNSDGKDAESTIIDFVQNIVNGYSLRKKEYFQFVETETVNVEELISILNKTRLIYRLYSLSSKIIEENHIEPNHSPFQPFSKNSLLDYLKNISIDINESINQLDKMWLDDEFDGMTDEEMLEIRSKRKKFRSLKNLCKEYRETIENMALVKLSAHESIETEPKIPPSVPELVKPEVKPAELPNQSTPENATTSLQEPIVENSVADNPIKIVDYMNPQEAEPYVPVSFTYHGKKWEVTDWGNLYYGFLIILYANSMYKSVLRGYIGMYLYGGYGTPIDFSSTKWHLQKPLEISKFFYAEGDLSTIEIIEHIKVLLELCNIDYGDMVIEYDSTELLEDETDISEELQLPEQVQEPLQEIPNQTFDVHTEPKKIVSHTPLIFSDSTDSFIRVVDYNNPEKCTHCKPVAFTFYHAKWQVTSWQKLYQRFLSVLYAQSKGKNILKNYIGKPLYGVKIDFTDSTTKWHLRKPLEIAEDFYAEGNLSTIDIIRHIKFLLELCNIDYHDMVIEYVPSQTAFVEETNTPAPQNISLSEKIVEIIKQNLDNLQYEDGFGAYEIRNLLSHEGITNVSETEIEQIMARCDELTEVDEGYYTYQPKTQEISVETQPERKAPNPPQNDTISPAVTESRYIRLMLNGNFVRTYDVTDAFYKICEFAIKCKPFEMALIPRQNFHIGGNPVFCRDVVPVNGYHRLSNGLQVMPIYQFDDLQAVTNMIKTYCQIDDNMVVFLNE